MPSDLCVICEELRQIGLQNETPAGRKMVNESLSSKWDGVRVAAAKALSQWGDARSVSNLKELLVEVATAPRRSSTTSAVVKALRPHLQFSDLDWAIELFVHRSHGHDRRAV